MFPLASIELCAQGSELTSRGHITEQDRIAALHEYGILDTQPDSDFDDITRMAAQICGAPISTITLIDVHRQWFKSRVGMPVNETEREISMCAHVVAEERSIVVSDATVDERFKALPHVAGDPGLRFYAGVPLKAAEGPILGALCVMDLVVRDLSPEQLRGLESLARMTMHLMELRRTSRIQAETLAVLQQSERAARENALHKDAMLAASLDCLITINRQGRVIEWNPASEATFGYPAAEAIGRPITDLIIPERYKEAHVVGFQKFLACGEGPVLNKRFEIEALRADGSELMVELAIVPFKLDDEYSFTAYLRDISRRREGQRRLEEAARELEDRVTQRTADLERANRLLLNQVDERLVIEADLRDQREFLRQVIDTEPNLVFVKSPDGRFVMANEALAAVYGVTVPDVVGKTDHDLSSDEEQVLRFRRDDTEVITTGQEMLIPEERVIDAEGKVRWLQTVKRPFKSPDGKMTYLLGIATDITARKQAELEWTHAQRDITRLHRELSEAFDATLAAYDATIEGWSRALDLRDKETEGHSRRVTEMTLELAREFGFDGQRLAHVRRGALLHDIGKMGIPDQILLKPGPLDDEEWSVMRLHPVYAYEMLLPIDFLRPALAIPYSHHEKWDGTGYPLGLKGHEIPHEARLFAVVDVWDALSSNRPYRTAWPYERVMAHIVSLSGAHFDPEVVEAFFKFVGK